MDTLSHRLEVMAGPIITSWIFFILNIVITFLLVFSYNNYLFILITVFWLSISTLVTITFERNNYYLYLSALITCAILEVGLSISLYNLYRLEYHYYGFLIGVILVEWFQIIVLYSFNDKVKTYINKEKSNENLVNNNPSLNINLV